jgi:hypothetical protein
MLLAYNQTYVNELHNYKFFRLVMRFKRCEKYVKKVSCDSI